MENKRLELEILLSLKVPNSYPSNEVKEEVKVTLVETTGSDKENVKREVHNKLKGLYQNLCKQIDNDSLIFKVDESKIEPENLSF